MDIDRLEDNNSGGERQFFGRDVPIEKLHTVHAAASSSGERERVIEGSERERRQSLGTPTRDEDVFCVEFCALVKTAGADR